MLPFIKVNTQDLKVGQKIEKIQYLNDEGHLISTFPWARYIKEITDSHIICYNPMHPNDFLSFEKNNNTFFIEAGEEYYSARYSKDELREKLNIEYSGYLSFSNHIMDNGWCMVENWFQLINGLEDRNFNLLGICKAPYEKPHMYEAIVVEDKDTFEVFWCHFNKEWVNTRTFWNSKN